MAGNRRDERINIEQNEINGQNTAQRLLFASIFQTIKNEELSCNLFEKGLLAQAM